MTSCQGHYISSCAAAPTSFATWTLKSAHLCLTRSEEDIAAMTTMIGDPTVSSTTPTAVPVYNPTPVTRAPQGQQMSPAPQGQRMTPAPHQAQETTPTSQPAVSSGSGGDILGRESVRSDQLEIGDKCRFTLSPGHFAAVSKYRGGGGSDTCEGLCYRPIW